MSKEVIQIENLGKLYRLGEYGTGTLSHDLNRWWARMRGKEDPFSKVGEVNDRTVKATKGEKVWALRDLSLSVNHGEVLGVIGKNGAGKSTLLKVLSRVTSPTTGNVKIKGRIASLLEVGTGFHPEMTGRENIYLNGTIMGMRKKEIDSKLDEIVDFAGVAKYLDTPAKRYSSGMTVRLGFAVAAFLDSEILIVDEVLAVGDAEFQKKAIGKMKDISSGDGRTVLFVSHNMNSIQKLCTRAIILKQGTIDFEGNVREGVQSYLNLNESNNSFTGRVQDNHVVISSPLAKITGIQKLNQSSSGDDLVLFHQPLEFNIFLDVNEEIRNLHLDLLFYNEEGGVVSYAHYEDGNLDLLDFNKGQHCLQVWVKNDFLPGKYNIQIGLHGKEGKTISSVNGVLPFSVSNLSDGSSSNYNYDWKYGNVYTETKWKIK